MILCIDIGNTDIHGGVYDGASLRLEFRRSNQVRPGVDELGLFFLGLFQAHGLSRNDVTRAAIASVVPDALPAVRGAAEKYLGVEPLVLQAGVKTGLKIRTQDPREVGADRIATGIAATHLFPRENLIVLDMGTATTVDALSAEQEFLGGAILAGVGLQMHALGRGTAQLPLVDIAAPPQALGRNTITNIQSGLYHGHLGALREVIDRISAEAFAGNRPRVVATGGFSRLFLGSGLFDHHEPALVLLGLRLAAKLNQPDFVAS